MHIQSGMLSTGDRTPHTSGFKYMKHCVGEFSTDTG